MVVVILCSRLQALVVNYVEIQMLSLSLSVVAFRFSQLFLIVVVVVGALLLLLFVLHCLALVVTPPPATFVATVVVFNVVFVVVKHA